MVTASPKFCHLRRHHRVETVSHFGGNFTNVLLPSYSSPHRILFTNLGFSPVNKPPTIESTCSRPRLRVREFHTAASVRHEKSLTFPYHYSYYPYGRHIDTDGGIAFVVVVAFTISFRIRGRLHQVTNDLHKELLRAGPSDLAVLQANPATASLSALPISRRLHRPATLPKLLSPTLQF